MASDKPNQKSLYFASLQHARTAARFVEEAHDGQNYGGHDNNPLNPGCRPPEYGQHGDNSSQNKPAEAYTHGTNLLP